MSRKELLVLGGGISGASLAFHAAQAGRKVLLVEKRPTVGGCLRSVRSESGYWFELGAHTCYNSYGALLEIIEASGQLGELVARGKPALRFLDEDRPVAGKNLGLLLKLFDKLELLRCMPNWIGSKQAGLSVRDYYSRLVGKGNYERVLGPMLSAVPSQTADEFPSDMLFKKRERRKDVMRSFTVEGGLSRLVDGLLAHPGIEVHTECTATRVERSANGFVVDLASGIGIEADRLAFAVPPGVVSTLLADSMPELAALAGRIRSVEIDSLGFAVRADSAKLPHATFFIPLRDSFLSLVTRDVVPDENWRAFSFHFRSGLSREDRLTRARQVVGVEDSDMISISENRAVLPSPVAGHAKLVLEIDRALKTLPLAITGNWFSGLAIEDCVLRSASEWRRISRLA